jgi:hypothetical protein
MKYSFQVDNASCRADPDSQPQPVRNFRSLPLTALRTRFLADSLIGDADRLGYLGSGQS